MESEKPDAVEGQALDPSPMIPWEAVDATDPMEFPDEMAPTEPEDPLDGAALRRLEHLLDPRTREMQRLYDQLAARATAEKLTDITYSTVDTPVGSLLLAATERGLVRVAFERQDHQRVLEQLAQDVSPRILAEPSRLREATRQLDEYFSGDRTTFELPLDLRLPTGTFRHAVLHHLPDIRYGQTESYTQVAAAAGSPRAVRAVGTACANNPLPVVVPCHRVVRSDGSWGQYAGGAEAKRTLLEMEAAA
ncbi:methylated-DNA--[protein]-cysteine S-methyltransferase [Streptomyces sp. NPDC005438]|uniref:methylated-DNA--[protein]-cysteine S-methyltransferase n=1 Tax=Streptomyces sp. NPDC005438 TaxID=3156880 RepID=UPI0033A97CF5